MPTDNRSALLSRAGAAFYLSQHHFPVTARRLAELASDGGGPVYRRGSNGRALYAIEDLDRWATQYLSPPIRCASDLPIRRQMAAMQCQ